MGDLSEHFSSSEFACRCGCGYDKVSPKLIQGLEELRVLVGKPIKINSGCRCKKHNDETPGSEPNSKHLLGQAADIVVKGVSPMDVFSLARQTIFKQGGRGLYDTFTHVDVGTGNNRPGVWDRRSK